jgi:hypothetical protein
MRIKIQLLMLSIMALIQPFMFFYWLHNPLFMVIYCFLGFVFTCICIVKTYIKWRTHGLSDLIWSLLIPVMAILSSSFLNMYLVDSIVFMAKREAIVKKIKQSPELIQESDYTHQSFLPISMKNHVGIQGTAKEVDIYFQTVDDGFLNTYERGVMYSDKPEKIETYEKRRTSQSGVVDEASFRIKKIKPHWYFYEYEMYNISD